MLNLKTRDKVYVIVPSTLLGLVLILMIFNNYITSYMPPRLLLSYPLKPCWPNNHDIFTEGIPFVYEIHISNMKSVYHVGEPINPSLVSTTSIAVYIPRIYIQNSQNQTIWVYGGLSISDNCRITLHYNLQDLTEPPKISQPGQYTIFAGSQDKFASYQFSVVS